MKKFIKITIKDFLNESINNELLVGDFTNHYFNGSGINIFNIPKDLINKLPEYLLDSNTKLYAGVENNRSIENIKSWTLDSETAKSFSEKYNDGKIVELSYNEFTKYFNYFVSMDVIYDYICSKNLNTIQTDKYVSESEIVILNK